MNGKRTWIDVPIVRLLPAAWAMATIWWLSDRETLPKPPGLAFELWSVLGHFTMFGLLAIAVWFGLGMNSRMLDRERTVYAIAIATLYGLLDEFHQRYVPGRQPDLMDVLVDFLGATAFVLIIPRLYDRLTR